MLPTCAALLADPRGICTADPATDPPFVSMLVPARDEAANIEACVRSLLAQDYPPSRCWCWTTSRRTAPGRSWRGWPPRTRGCGCWPAGRCRLAGWARPTPAASWPRRRGATGCCSPTPTCATRPPLRRAMALAQLRARGGPAVDLPPPGHRHLGRAAGGAADAHFAVYRAAAAAAHAPAARPAFAAANGQFLLFRARRLYRACGGHAAVRDRVLEDVGLARAVKAAGYRVALADGGDLVQPRCIRRAGARLGRLRQELVRLLQPLAAVPGRRAGRAGPALHDAPILWLLAGLARTAIIGVPSLREGWIWLGLPLLQYGCGVAMRLLLAARFRFSPPTPSCIPSRWPCKSPSASIRPAWPGRGAACGRADRYE